VDIQWDNQWGNIMNKLGIITEQAAIHCEQVALRILQQKLVQQSHVAARRVVHSIASGCKPRQY
jgi:hypothetical protein